MSGPARMSEWLTVAAALDDAGRRLGAAGIEDARREARLLLGHATGLEPAAIIGHPERRIAPEAARILARRLSRTFMKLM